jgi:desulfoferrodoxin (superoxide reductase-like protein)
VLYWSSDDDDTESSNNNLNPKKNGKPTVSISRRTAFISASALAAGGTVTNHLYTGKGGLLTPYSAFAYEGPPLFEQVKAIESANRIGQPFTKIFEPNSNGAPEKHLPQISIAPGTTQVSFSVPHVMTEEHYIQFMWLKDAKSGDVVLVKALPPTDASPPTLTATVPDGVTLRPYLFCNIHGLWKGEDFVVTKSAV